MKIFENPELAAFRPLFYRYLACGLAVGAAAFASAEPELRWHSDAIVESRMPVYQYHRGPPYERPTEPGAPNPGVNYGSMTLTVSDEPPRLLDRLLPRDAIFRAEILNAPAEAVAARFWIKDNYGRVLDDRSIEKQTGAGGPAFAGELSVARALHIGITLNAELTDGERVLWRGTDTIRLLPPPEDPWDDFMLGVYNMGTRPGTGELWRRLGLQHRAIQTTNDPTFPAQHDLRFHASNILYSLLGLYHRDHKRWREIRAAQTETRGPMTLARHRCLSDPKEEKFITDILTAAAMRFAPFKPLHYSIGDEIGIGQMCSPHDLCASEWCLARYRAWLSERYGAVETLNAQWGTAYGAFDEAEMFSTWQALERARTDWNFSPWADRLEFMDKVLYDAVALGVRTIREIDPDARVNLSGVQQPSCWQSDHWRLANTVNCATPYEIGEGPDVLMSFFDDGKKGKLHSPGFGRDTEGVWRAFLRGYHIAAQWDSFGDRYSDLIDIENNTLTPFGERISAFSEWVRAGPGRLRERSERRRDPVAILYSQPSLRGNWILEMTARPDVHDAWDKWVTRGSWSVRQREKSFRVRVSWVQWTHDVGIWPKFVDVSQVAEGYLEAEGFKVLILPRAVALSDRTAAAIRAFVEAGGTVVADTWAGLMDDRCRMRGNGGALDDLFGVRRGDWKNLDLTVIEPGETPIVIGGRQLPFVAFERTLKADGGEAAASAGGADVVVSRSVGQGRAVYLNFDMEHYRLHRVRPGWVDDARTFLLELFETAGVKPRFQVKQNGRPHAVGHDLCLYANGRGWLLGVMQNPSVMYSEIGGVESRYAEIEDNVFDKVREVELHGPPGFFAYDLTDGGRFLGGGDAWAFTSEPLSGRLFAFWPFEITGLEASAEIAADRMLRIAGRLSASSPIVDERLVVFLRVFDGLGAEQRAYSRTLDAHQGAFGLEMPLGLGESGTYTVEIADPCTGLRRRMTVELPE